MVRMLLGKFNLLLFVNSRYQIVLPLFRLFPETLGKWITLVDFSVAFQRLRVNLGWADHVEGIQISFLHI